MLKKNRTLVFHILEKEGLASLRFTLSTRWLQLGVIAAFICVLSLTTILVDYVGLQVKATQNKHLTVENTQLKKQLGELKGKVSTLENSTQRLKLLYTKLKLIFPTTPNREDKHLQLAMGPLPKNGHALSYYNSHLYQREPAHELEKKDSSFSHDQNYAPLSVRIDRAIKDSSLQEINLLQMYENLNEHRERLNATPSISPVWGWQTSHFGYRISPFTGSPVMHEGLDIAAASGTPIKAPSAGVVSFVGYDSGYGKVLTIDHGYGIVTRYGHASEIYVDIGQKVSRSETIAAVGNTGRSTGPHLHYEVRLNGVPIDPSTYIFESPDSGPIIVQ